MPGSTDGSTGGTESTDQTSGDAAETTPPPEPKSPLDMTRDEAIAAAMQGIQNNAGSVEYYDNLNAGYPPANNR